MTCKDCVHYEVCVFHTKGTENEKCMHFKPKSRIVELPCEVGQTVYFAVEDYHDSAIIDEIRITKQGIVFDWSQYEVGVDITELWDQDEFGIEAIGKTVFLSREEAENALKER